MAVTRHDLAEKIVDAIIQDIAAREGFRTLSTGLLEDDAPVREAWIRLAVDILIQ